MDLDTNSVEQYTPEDWMWLDKDDTMLNRVNPKIQEPRSDWYIDKDSPISNRSSLHYSNKALSTLIDNYEWQQNAISKTSSVEDFTTNLAKLAQLKQLKADLNDSVMYRYEQFYFNRIKAGHSGAETFWSSKEAQLDRFRTLSDVGDLQNKSILDIGCGHADLYDYIKLLGLNVNYTGVDIVPETARQAKQLHPNVRIYQGNILETTEPLEQVNYVFASGIFALSIKGWSDYVKAMLSKMYELCSEGVAVNFLSNLQNSQVGLHYSTKADITFIVEQLHVNNYYIFTDPNTDDYVLYMYR